MTVYCYCENCKYRSKRKSKTVNKAGEPMYKCLRKAIVIGELDGSDFMNEHAECYTAVFPEEDE
ncbi:MAG: hypothetical protein K6G10_02705 [Butyrivibrio sp.]|nr:hypothetical protein [Butyrivibrio sp.]